LSDSVQTEVPVVHTIVPMRQGLVATGQVVPEAHTTQAPSRQTEPSSQTVPLDFTRWVSLQVVAPLSPQTVSPSWQGLAGMQVSPAMQAPALASVLFAAASAAPDPPVPAETDLSVPPSGEGANGRLCLQPVPIVNAIVTPTTTAHRVMPGLLHTRILASTNPWRSFAAAGINQNAILHATQGSRPFLIPGLHASAAFSASAEAGSVNHKTNPVAARTPAPTSPPSSRR
jgi:hypothetical protein